MIREGKRNILGLKEIEGKTIVNAEIITPEIYGRELSDELEEAKYFGLVFTDGTRLLLLGEIPCKPDPYYEEMQEHPRFFDSEDLAEKVKRDEEEERRKAIWRRTRDYAEYERLKKKFEYEKMNGKGEEK